MKAHIVAPTADEIRQWPVTVRAVPEAARVFGLGPDAAYRLIRTGEFPVKVLKLGRNLRVTRAALMEALDIPETAPAPSNSLATGPNAQV